MLSDKPVPAKDRLIVALDLPSADQARTLIETLGDAVQFYKIGFELFLAGGCFAFVDGLVERGKKVFLDLKLFDVPATVKATVGQLQGRGVTLTTVHGNDAILRAACEAKGEVKVLAVTALTSLDRGDLDDLGFACDVEALVLSRARRALAIGCDGVVSSGLEVARLRREIGERLILVTPGIRPVQNRSADDQKRVVSVEQAFQNGADYIVMGRPIHGAADPRAAAESVQMSIARTFSS
jgi:orotidine-5'-phosphate decarboxylase